MKNKIFLANMLLEGTGISIIDAVRLIMDIVDTKPKSDSSAIGYCRLIMQSGLKYYKHNRVEISVNNGFKLYLESKKELREASFRDIKYIGGRILRRCPYFADGNFSDITLADCEEWLSHTFETPSQFNKGRTILHGLFEFALRHEWCDRNPVNLVARKKVVETEIKPLTLSESEKILDTAKATDYRRCAAAIGLLLWTGMRPTEVRRLKWRDIDLKESIVTVRSQCSKTGGIRQVEICHALKHWLYRYKAEPEQYLCPDDWSVIWRKIRNDCGFKNRWIPDVLRHTYASFHAKYFRDLPRLQLNMGHRDLCLLRSRYINMGGISKADAKKFFFYSRN